MRSRLQNALLRESTPRLPSWGKAHPTEKRSLPPAPHVKAQSGWPLARRVRLLVSDQDRVRFSVRFDAQSALFREAQVAECASP